jgi:hypothetical protein
MGFANLHSTTEGFINMTSINLGTNSFFKSMTAEALLLEVITYMQDKELSISSNSTGKDFVQITYNLNNMTAVSSFTIPAIQSINDSGQVVTSGSDYLQGITFTPGEGGTFRSSGLSQYLLEIVTFLQIKEADLLINTQNENNIFSSYDADDKIFSGNITLPLTVSFDDLGRPVITAKEYLL